MRTRALLLALALVLAGGCRVERPGRTPTGHARDVVITAVPLLTRELAAIYPFLRPDLPPRFGLEDKEVYAFVPSSITVQQGDTLRLTLVNPEDDEHNFVLPELAVRMPGLSTTQATWIARRAGIYTFTCTIPAHAPLMWGQIVVLRRDAFQARY